MATLTVSSGKTIKLGKELGSGGEGAVYNVVGAPKLVAKIYHAHRINAALEAKLRAMVAAPPDDATRQPPLNHVSITWPIDIVLNNGRFCGYIMPKLPKSDNLYDLLQPQQRAKQHASLNHRHLYRTARNLAIALDAIHQKGYVVGDVNFKNALFNDDALITIVDCDSMQVNDAQGVIHHCLVGVPEYTPPELQGKDFSKTTRTANHDAFGLAVLIFQLLMQGFHPFAGRPTAHAPDVEQSHIYCITKGIFPYLDGQLFVPPKAAPALVCLPGVLRILFERAFTQPNNRPTPKEWATVIALVENRLVPCANDVHHYYPSDGQCVICEVDYNVGKRKRTAPPPNTQTSAQQVPLQTTTSSRPAPAPTSRPAPQARPITNTLPNLPTGPTPNASPQPRSQNQPRTGRSWTRTLIPVVVIITALWWLGQNLANRDTTTAAPAPTQTVTQAQTALERATAVPTAVPTALPTSVAPTAQIMATANVGAAQYCDAETLLTGVWPQLPSAVRNAFLLTPYRDTLADRYIQPVPLTALENASTNGISWRDMAQQCGDTRIIYTHPQYSDVPSYVACDGNTCATGITAAVRDVNVVARQRALWPTLNVDSSDAVLKQFVNGVFNSQAPVNVAIVSNRRPDDVWNEHLLPIIQKPLITQRYNKSFWIDQGKSSVQRLSTTWPTSYSPINGIQSAQAPVGSTYVMRTVTLPILSWNDGEPLKASDYQRWWEQCVSRGDNHPACYFIVAFDVLSESQFQIRYIPGLPQSIADTIAPYARQEQHTSMWYAQIGDWKLLTPTTLSNGTARITSPNNGSIEITLYRPDAMQPLLDGLRQNAIDLVIIESDTAPISLTPLYAEASAAMQWEFVPNGGVYIVR